MDCGSVSHARQGRGRYDQRSAVQIEGRPPPPCDAVKASTKKSIACTDTLLVMVADGPRHWKALPKEPGSPFACSLNDLQGRARLGALLGNADAGACRPQAGQAGSDGDGAMLSAAADDFKN